MSLRYPLSLVIAALVAAVTLAGLFDASPGKPFAFVTPRGEHATLCGSGLYRFDPAAVAREGKVWDAITLILAVPLLVVAALRSAASMRWRIMHAGVLAYLVYMYLMYVVMVAFNYMFLMYIAIYSLSGVAFVWELQRIDTLALSATFGPTFPRTTFIAYCGFVAAAISFMWLTKIIPMVRSNMFPDELAGLTTLHTQAFDLGMVVPAAAASALLLWKKHPLGYLLTGIVITFGLMMDVTIPAWILSGLIYDGAFNALEAIPFFLIAVAGAGLFVAFFRNAAPTPPMPRWEEHGRVQIEHN